VIGVERWAEIRRLYFVEKRSKRAIHRLTWVHRDTITRALISDQPPKYERAPAGSKLDPFREMDLRAAAGGPVNPVVAAAGDGHGAWVPGRQVDL
jgi:hypothetical protein